MKKINQFYLTYKNIFLGQFSNIISFGISTILLFLNLYYLSIEDRGIYSLIYTLPSLLIISTDFGITPIIIRYVSRNINLNSILSSLLLFHLLRSLFALIIGLTIIYFTGYYLFNVQNNLLYLALPIIFSSSANSFLTPFFYGKNKITVYYVFLLLPNFLILLFSIFLIYFDFFNLYNIIYFSLFVHIIHSIIVLLYYVHESKIHNIIYYKEFNNIFKESKFLYISNLLSYGFIYVFPILINFKFGIVNLSYILFCISISDKLFLIGDSVGYEIIRKINLNKSENIFIKFKYLFRVLIFMIPLIIFSSIIIYLTTKYFLLDYIFLNYKPAIAFLLIILFQYLFQSVQRIILQFFNGLGKVQFTLYISFFSVILKFIFILFADTNLYNLILFMAIVDFLILLLLFFIIHSKYSFKLYDSK
jgi:O-antigen/teichoic acid export membrane protein